MGAAAIFPTPTRKSNAKLWLGVAVGGLVLIFGLIGGCVALTRRAVNNPAVVECQFVTIADQADGIVLQLMEGAISADAPVRKLERLEVSLNAQGRATKLFVGYEARVDSVATELAEVRTAVATGEDSAPARAALRDAAGGPEACGLSTGPAPPVPATAP